MGTDKKGVSARRQTADKSGEWRFPCDSGKPCLFMSGDYPMMKGHHGGFLILSLLGITDATLALDFPALS